MYVLQPRRGLGPGACPGPGQGICCSPRTSLPTVTAPPCVFLLLVAFEHALRGDKRLLGLAQLSTFINAARLHVHVRGRPVRVRAWAREGCQNFAPSPKVQRCLRTHSLEGSVPEAPAHVSVLLCGSCGGGGGATATMRVYSCFYSWHAPLLGRTWEGFHVHT